MISNRRRRVLVGSTVFLVLITMSGCQSCPPVPPAAKIHYSQAGACYGISDQVGVGQANYAFVFFHISGIDNSQTTKSFAFAPTKLHLNIGSLYSSYSPVTTAQYASALGLTPAKARTVNQGSSVTMSEYVVFLVDSGDPDGVKGANSTNYFLHYSADPTDPGVLPVKKDPGKTSWPYTKYCGQIQFPK